MTASRRALILVSATVVLAAADADVALAGEQGGLLGSLLPATASGTAMQAAGPAGQKGGIMGSLLKPEAPAQHLTDHDRFETVRASYGTHYACVVARRRWTRSTMLGFGIAAPVIGAAIHGFNADDFGHLRVYGMLGLEALAGLIVGYRVGAAIAPDCASPEWDAVERSPADRLQEGELKYRDCMTHRKAAIVAWTAGTAVFTGVLTALAVRSVTHTAAARRWADLGGAVLGVAAGALLGWPAGADRAPRCGAEPRLEDFAAPVPAAPVIPAVAPSATVN